MAAVWIWSIWQKDTSSYLTLRIISDFTLFLQCNTAVLMTVFFSCGVKTPLNSK